MTLRETEDTALLHELHLIISKVCPMTEFSFFIFRLIGINIGGSSMLELGQDIEERPQIVLGLLSNRAFSRLGNVEKSTGDDSNLVRLDCISKNQRKQVTATYKAITIRLHVDSVDTGENNQEILDDIFTLCLHV